MKGYDHIFIVTNDLSNERRVKRIIDVIVGQDRSVLLIGRELSDSAPLNDADYAQHRVKCFFNTGPLFYLEFYLRVTFVILREFTAEHITCNDLDTVLIGKTLKRFRQFHFYLDCHEWFEEVPELQGNVLKKWIWKRIAKHCIPATDSRYTVNSLIGEQMAAAYDCDFKVVQNISPTLKTINWDLKEPLYPVRLVYLGVLNEGRGLESLIKSMDHLDGVVLDIIGDGDIADQVKRLIDDSPAKDRIVLHGSLTKEEFMPLLERAHVGVNLLESSSKSYYYSSANKIHDYINHGLMVLTMDYPYHRLLAESCDSIKLIDKLEDEVVVKNIKTMIDEYDSAGIKSGRIEVIQLYNWKKVVNEIYEIYLKQ